MVVVLHVGFLQICAGVVPFDLEDGVEETPVFVVHLGELHGERLVPSVRIGDWVDGLGCCRAQNPQEKTGPHGGAGALCPQ